MRLSDYILAARGGLLDMGGFARSMGPRIEQAERFEVSDDVVEAAGELMRSRPSSLVAALPLCRLPYDKTWIEFRGGQGPRQVEGESYNDMAPVPVRQGALVESIPGGQVGMMTFAWLHRGRDGLPETVNMTPVSIFFDFRKDGDVREEIKLAHSVMLEQYDKLGMPGLHDLLGLYSRRLEIAGAEQSPEHVSQLLAGSKAWSQYTQDKREIEALRELDRHMGMGLSPHGAGLASMVLSRADPKAIGTLLARWEADVHGEGTFVMTFLAMLNSRNPVVEHERVDVTRLNKSRRKNGRSEFLTYSKTRLAMSRSQKRIAAARGVPHEVARQHLVRGHFKIRATGVFWWSPFLRGDAKRGTVKRQEYAVLHGG